jgi:RHS repeat-associated protein
LPFDQEKGGYQNRNREYTARIQQFAQRDAATSRKGRRVDNEYRDAMSLYAYVRGLPLLNDDPSGQSCCHCIAWVVGLEGATRCCDGQPEACINPYFSPPYPGWATCVAQHEAVHKQDCHCTPGQGDRDCSNPEDRPCSECHAFAQSVNCLFDHQDADCGSNTECRLAYACRIWDKCHSEADWCAQAGEPPEHSCGPKPTYCPPS